MKKRPLCAICILFLVIQGIRVLFFGVEEMKLSPLEKALPRESGVELTGTVYRIEEKKKVTAVFLKDNVVSSTDQTVRESKVLVYISGNQSEQSVPVRIGNRLCIRGETQTFERARNPGNFDQKTYYQRQGIHVLIWAEKISVVSDRTAPLRQFLSELKSEWNKRLVRHLGDYYGPAMSAILLGEKSGLDPEMKTMYQKCGISHLLAISYECNPPGGEERTGSGDENHVPEMRNQPSAGHKYYLDKTMCFMLILFIKFEKKNRGYKMR